jgi:cyclase
MVDVVRKTAEKVTIPLSVGGGIRTVDDFKDILEAGADKVAVNTAAVNNPELISDAAKTFGSSRVVLAIDAKQVGIEKATGLGKYNVLVSGGGVDTGIDLISWAKEGEQLGAGEILLTSLDRDGTKCGFDLPMLRAVCEAVNIPIVASGGGGDLNSFVDLFLETNVDAALAASVFHFGEYKVDDIKTALRSNGIPVR